MLVVYAFFSLWQEKNQVLVLFQKLSNHDKTLIKAVENASKQQNPTTECIAAELQKITHTLTDESSLTERLDAAEKIGLLKKVLVNKQDQPALAWRSLVPRNSL